MFDDAGVFKTSVTLPSAGGEPADIAQAPNGDFFVLRSEGTVQRLDSSLAFIESWSAPGRYYGINVYSAGKDYAAGSGSSQGVGIYDTSGILQSNLKPASGTNLRDTVKVGTDTWISSFDSSSIIVFNVGGTEIGSVPSPSAPFGMQLAPNGDVWVVDQDTHEVRRITPAGTQAFSFDADNGPNGTISGQLRYLGVAPDGSLFIPHRNGSIVDVYTETGSHLFTLSDPTLSKPDGILATGFLVVPELSPVPTLSSWAIILLVLALGLTAYGIIRRKA